MGKIRSWELFVQFSHPVMSDSLWLHGLQHARPPCPSSTPGVHSNSCPLSQWCHPTISSRLQSFPASGSFPVSQLFTSGGQSIGVSASASVFPVNIQDWFPLGWTGWICLLSKELSRVFSNTTVQKHQFFSAQFSLWSNCHIHTWLREHSYIELNNYYRDSCTLLLTKRGIQKRTANIDDQRTKDQNTDSNLSEFL